MSIIRTVGKYKLPTVFYKIMTFAVIRLFAAKSIIYVVKWKRLKTRTGGGKNDG